MTPERIALPFRFWMTGSVAVVMAALCYTRVPDVERRHSAPRTLRHSAFGVGETVERIEHAARDRGLSVLARRDGREPVIVLASKAGVTPVVMRTADAPPDVPFAVHVMRGADGRTLVYLDASRATLPPDVERQLAELPALIEGALSEA